MAIMYDRYGNVRYASAGISYPEAYRVPKGTQADEINRIKPPIVKAASFRASNRPDVKHYDYLCPGCLAPVHWVIGSKKRNQPKKSSSQPNYGRPFFRHNPNHLDKHLSMAAPVLVADLAVAIDNIATAYGWEYKNLETYSTTARRISLLNPNAYKNDVEVEFVIAPNRTTQVPEDYNGVIITTSGKMTQGHKSLLLLDSNANVLTAEKLHEYLQGDGENLNAAKSLMVSGILRPETIPQLDYVPEGELTISRSAQRFIHDPRNLVTVMVNIMNDTYHFVDHADLVPDYYVPTKNRYGIVNKKDARALQKMVDDYSFVLSREVASNHLVDTESCLSRGSDNKAIAGTNGKYRYGKADFVTFTPYTQGRQDQLVVPGAHKILINPEPWNISARINRKDWENTLIVFFEADHLHKKFVGHHSFHQIKQIETAKVISTTRLKTLTEQAIYFLGNNPMFEATASLADMASAIEKRMHHADLVGRPQETLDVTRSDADSSNQTCENVSTSEHNGSLEANKPKTWDLNRNFIDFETGARAL